MLNHHSNTPHISNPASEAVRGTKRVVDSQWLKGSYVSKRARWDRPAIATPTPHPDVGERYKRRHESFPRRAALHERTSRQPPRVATGFADIPSAPRSMDISSNPDTPDLRLPNDGDISGTFLKRSTSKKSSYNENNGLPHQLKDTIDDSDERSQISVFTSSLRYSSRGKSQQRSHELADASLVDGELTDMNTITLHGHSSPSILPSGCLMQNRTLSSYSNKLPKHLRKTFGIANSRNAGGMNGEDKYSFITEVAPSSRDLEMFQYRKKRKIVDSEAIKPGSSTRTQATDFDQSPQIASQSDLDDAEEPRPDDLSSIEAAIENKPKIAPDAETPPISEIDGKESSNHSDESWEIIEDAGKTPSLHIIKNEISVKTDPTKRLSDSTPKSPLSPTQSKMLACTSSQHPKHSQQPNQSSLASQTLPDLRRNSLRPSATTKRVGLSQDLNDVSTQSYNTSPPKATIDKPSKQLSQPNPETVRNGAESSEKVQDAVGDVQQSAAQPCPSFTSFKSTRSEGDRVSEDGARCRVGEQSINEVSLYRKSTPRPNGPKRVSRASVEGLQISEFGGANGPARMAPAMLSEHVQQTQKVPKQMPVRIEPTDESLRSEERIMFSATRLTSRTHSSPKDVTAPDFQPRTSLNGPGRDEAEDAPSISGSLTGSCRLEPSISKTANLDSDTSWEGCGPQSPWTTENLELPPISAASRVGQSQQLNSNTSLMADKVSLLEHDLCPEEQDWEHLERVQTPQNDITPFKDLMSPTPARQGIDGDAIPTTQSLVDAATNNPWTSNLRNPSSKKYKKRVSFGVASSEEKDSYHTTYKRIPASPPPPHNDSVEDIYDDSAPVVPKFVRHFVVARQSRHILPQPQSSPLKSSPQLGAQAEAFIAADREVSIERRRPASSPKSSSRKPKSTRDYREDNFRPRDRSVGSRSSSPKLPERKIGNLMASFDMDDAIGDMSDFLGDWSVEAELKDARESKDSDSSRRRESNGYKRRTLFGLV